MVYEANFTPQKAVDEPTAAMMSWMLQGVVQAGTGNSRSNWATSGRKNRYFR